MKDCLFCQTNKIKADILWKSQNFFIKVGIGILAPGHVMLLPKKHIPCFAELPEKLIKEFLFLKDNLSKKIKSNFSEPIIYEHGIYSQSINHAHLHFIPSQNEYYNLKKIKDKLFRSLKFTRIKKASELIKIFKDEGLYFYLEEKGKKWVFHTKGLPEGKFTFRKEFARLTGLYGLSDWRKMPKKEKHRNAEWVNLTKKVFKES